MSISPPPVSKPAPATYSRGDDDELLRAALDALPLHIFVKDRESRYLFCNRSLAAVFGASSEEMAGRSDFDYFPAKLAQHFVDDDRRVMSERSTMRYEEPFHRQGEDGWILTTKLPWFDAAGELGGVIGFFSDISARKRSEDRLRTLSRAVEQSQEAIAITDSDGRIEYVNPRHAELTGLSHDEAQGTQLHLLADESNTPDEQAAMWSLLRAGGVWHREFVNTRRDGSQCWIDGLVSAITDDHGQITHYVAVKEDITERKRIEQALARKTAIHAMLSRINGAIVKLGVRQALFAEVCQIALAHGGFVLAWIGEVAADGRVRVLASAGRDDSEAYLAGLTVHVAAELPTGRGATGTAIRENRPVIKERLLDEPATGPWREAARRHGLRSSMALPVRGGEFSGALSVYASEDDYFETEVVALLEEVAGDISFALAKIAEAERRERAETQLALYAEVFANSSDGMTITDADNLIVAVNQSFIDITGYRADEVIGKNPSLLKSGRHDRRFYQEMWHVLAAKGSWQGEIWNRRKDGDLYPAWVTINVVRGRGGKIIHYFAVFSDLVQKKAAEELSRLKRFDALTGLPNQLMMEDRVSEAIVHAGQHDRCVGLLFINLDHFHMVNDLFGHVAGDVVLRQSAGRMVDVVGTRGTVSRFSGDFFVVALPDLNAASEINPIAAALLTTIAEPYAVEGQVINLSARIGIAVYPNDGDDFATLMKNADAALVDAKVGGKNSFRFYTERMNEHAQRLLTIGAELRSAVAEQRLTLHYQPQVDLASGAIIGVEALMRITHAERGLIPPGEFIPVAEENGMIFALGEWAIEEACRQRRDWLDQGYGDFVVAVNVSALQMARGDLPEIVAQALARHGLAGPCLELEFTESMLMKNVERSLALMQRLRALGVRLSIDDFGTGYSSLAYLKQFPLDKLKIDQSFVRNLNAEGSDASIVQAIIALAQALELTTIAEGVESETQRDFLQQLGCREMQGYLFSRPLAASAVTLLLARR
jgi:diguanylate cyclase (GGDEF)-like protein/PAS domain S-box-containing protein